MQLSSHVLRRVPLTTWLPAPFFRCMVVVVALILVIALGASADPLPEVTRVRVVKGTRTLQLMSGDRVIREFRIALGGSPQGHKMRQGDERTPEGVYTLDYKNPRSHFYKSIHISYPNANDVASARARRVKPGGDIMIHGQKNGWGRFALLTQMVDWTDGCVALADSDMDVVWAAVREGTPVEIVP